MPLQPTENIIELVGNTPLLHLARFARAPHADIYAKLEYLNPGGSVKDRAALGMILDAEERGLLRPGSTIIEPTAGNTGIGLALVGVARGYRVILCVPEGYSREKMKVMEAFGGEIKYVSQEAGMQAAIDLAHELAGQIEDSFVPQQFANPANANFHEQTTAQEIIEQMDGRIDAIAMGAGTAGTFTGVARALKKINPQTLCVLVEPEGSIFGGGAPGSHKVEGIGQSQFIPANLDYSVADEIMMIYDDEAYTTVRRLAETEGVLCGGSSGVAAAAARRLAERLGAGQRIVTLFPDGAERYMSQGIFD
ncbi:MAG: PLP-dependent cysteine synthase family protein [Pyrinomonadaceae bacterium]|nr:cysteine synthase family protein [Pyrinomonadaceae bacterium]MDQ3585258.1 cysteine synthase family protein [Acidobacteriota bacterium]